MFRELELFVSFRIRAKSVKEWKRIFLNPEKQKTFFFIYLFQDTLEDS